MKFFFLTLVVGVLFIAAYFFSTSQGAKKEGPRQSTSSSKTSPSFQNTETVTTMAENLDTPWAVAILPTGDLLLTERPGRVRLITSGGHLEETPVATISRVKEIGEGGLLGIALHPEFASNNYVYLYYTYSATGGNTLNRVIRMTYRNNQLIGEQIILDRIPGASNHNGGRIKFGPDGMLYIGTGDAENPSQAQNTKTLGGKILRITPEGKPAPGNPFGNPVYSYGHRNVQGLAWGENGDLWATEHGRSGITSGLDELNLIQSGKNYGWPDIEGSETRSGMETPKRNSGPTTTWAPSGAAFIGSSLFFSGLRGRTLYEAVIDGATVKEVKEHFAGKFGRIREVIKGPDGLLYITTSNQDGRGTPSQGDDRVIRVNPQKL